MIVAGAAVVAAAVVGAACIVRSKKKNEGSDTDCIDGGVRHYVDSDSPKVIKSTDITCFECEAHTVSIADAGEMSGSYNFLVTDSVAEYSFMNRFGKTFEGSFVPDKDFRERLYKIVADYDFAQFNGTFYSVSGLPHGYGAKISVSFASGESIHASNNQSCFLPKEAIEEMYSLFRGYSTGTNHIKWNGMIASCVHPEISRGFHISITKNMGDLVFRGYLRDYEGEEYSEEMGITLSENGVREICALSLEALPDKKGGIRPPFQATDKPSERLSVTLSDGTETEKEYDDALISRLRDIVLREIGAVDNG